MREKLETPFLPDHPVPFDLFVGRADPLRRILERGARRVVGGVPTACFIEGEYGIGKSSVALYAQWQAYREYGLVPVIARLGGAKTLDQVGEAILRAVVERYFNSPSGAWEKTKDILTRYVGEQQLFGLTLRFDALREDAPKLANPFGLLGFLKQIHQRLREADPKVRGITLVLDELNGIAADLDFAHFLKGFWESNSPVDPKAPALPLLLILCGVPERRGDLIRNHQPVERIFDVVPIEPMLQGEVHDFYTKTFERVKMTVDDTAHYLLWVFTQGYPKIMHLLGDVVYRTDQDQVVDVDDVVEAARETAEEVGRRYVDQQVYAALRSPDYQRILRKLGALSTTELHFESAQLAAKLGDSEKRKLNNFLQKMKRLGVIASGETRGSYRFTSVMTRLYLYLSSVDGCQPGLDVPATPRRHAT